MDKDLYFQMTKQFFFNCSLSSKLAPMKITSHLQHVHWHLWSNREGKLGAASGWAGFLPDTSNAKSQMGPFQPEIVYDSVISHVVDLKQLLNSVDFILSSTNNLSDRLQCHAHFLESPHTHTNG